MIDLQIAVNALDNHALALCRMGELITSDERGISPMMKLIKEGKNLTGYCVADKVVGKAAALLFVKTGIIAVYAKVISKAGADFLLSHNVNFTYGEITDNIINRDKTDICPMEKTLLDIDDVEKGYELLVKKLNELKKDKRKTH